MARRVAIPFKDMALKVVGPLGDYLAARIQRLDLPLNITSNNIDELGNSQHAGTTTGIPEATATFQAEDVSIKLYAALTGTSATAYPAAGVDVSNLGKVDLIGVVKDADVADYIKSVHLRKCQITGFTYTYSVDAESTEEYTAGGSEKRWFKNDLVVDTYDAGASSPVTLSETPIVLKNGDYCVSVVLDGSYLTEVTGSPASDEYSVSGTSLSYADTVTSKLVVVYHANPTGTNWSSTADTSIPAGIRGKNVSVEIGAGNISRVQSVTIRGTFPNETIKEMGNTLPVGVIVQVPDITGDISVLDTDTELIALFTTGDPNSTDTEFRSCEFTASGISLEIMLRNPASGCSSSGNVLKTVYIPEIVITSEGHTTNVGGNATQTFSFKSADAQCIVYSGAR